MPRNGKRIWWIFLASILPAGFAASGVAHDGGFGHSRRTLFIAPAAEGFELEYRLQQEGPEALVEMTHIDSDDNGTIGDEEREAFLARRGDEIAVRLGVRDGRGRPLKLQLVSAKFDHGRVQRYRFLAPTAQRQISLVDQNFPHKPGIVQIRHGGKIESELVEQTDLTHADRVHLVLRKVD